MVGALRNIGMLFLGLVSSYVVGYMLAWTVGPIVPLAICALALWGAMKVPWGAWLAAGILAGGLFGIGYGALLAHGSSI